MTVYGTTASSDLRLKYVFFRMTSQYADSKSTSANRKLELFRHSASKVAGFLQGEPCGDDDDNQRSSRAQRKRRVKPCGDDDNDG